ncbi:MAG TPA: hypothetical protein DCG75_14720 [Bacteroidales bacterium]|nr:hypothetical protein [Bacteroidales bacterium]
MNGVLDSKIGWAYKKLNYKEIWEHTKGANIKIGLIDSGINPNSELENSISQEFNLIDNSTNAPDDLNHGTHIAGILCGHGPKLTGVCPESRLEIYKVISSTHYLDSGLLHSAIDKAIQNACHIISMSLEYYEYDDQIQATITQNRNNCVFIAAAGNKGKLNRIKDSYPASYKDCISVGAVDENNIRYLRSNLSNHIDVMAPGTNIYSCTKNNSYTFESDTSFAVPFVSGLAALLGSFQITNNSFDAQKIKDAILNSTIYLGDKIEYGKGLISPVNSFNYLKNLQL